MFNKKGKDILVWINCIVFILIIGLTTLKGTMKEGLIDKIGDIGKDVTKKKGDTTEKKDEDAVTITIPENCSKSQATNFTKYYKFDKRSQLYHVKNKNDWKEANKIEKIINMNDYYKILNEINKKYYKLKKIDKYVGHNLMNASVLDMDKFDTVMTNKALIYCTDLEDDENDKKKKKLYEKLDKTYGKEQKIIKCQWENKGKWNNDENKCDCQDEDLYGKDKYGNEEYIKRKGNRVKNGDYKTQDNVECKCWGNKKWEITKDEDTDEWTGKCKKRK